MPGTSVETGRAMVSDEAPKMAVRTIGSGPDVVLFHGGMGCWQHWIRNVDALAERFTVHALDHPPTAPRPPCPARRRARNTWSCSTASSRSGSRGRAAALRRLLVRRRHRGAPRPAPRASRDPPVPGLAGRVPHAEIRRAAHAQLSRGGGRRRAVPGDLPPQSLDQHAERSGQRHRGDHRHPGVLRAQHALQQSKGQRRRDAARRPRAPARPGPRAVGRGRRLPVPARRPR